MGALHLEIDGALGLLIPVPPSPHQLPHDALGLAVSQHRGRALPHEPVHQHIGVPHPHGGIGMQINLILLLNDYIDHKAAQRISNSQTP